MRLSRHIAHTPGAAIAALALCAAITGCSDTALDDEAVPGQPALPISFTGAPSDTVSRGQVTTAANMETFAVSATVYSPSGDRNLYFAHEQYRFLYEGQDVYRTIAGDVHYWLSETDEYNFYAYTPSQYIYFPPGVVDRFIYTTPKNVALQPDIMVATSVAARWGKPVQLNFTHPLAQISLYQGEIVRRGRIVSVTFSGIIDHGEYNMLTGEWLMQSADTDTFVWNCDTYTRPESSLSGEYFNFFFIPQQLGPSAALTVVFEDVAGVTEVHHVDLDGTWQAGHHYRYALSLTD